MIINHNIVAINTLNKLNKNNKDTATSLEKLSSGLRINKASDDSAGLAISEKMRGQIRGLQQAQRNIQDGISLIQTAESAMNEVHSLLQRGRELSVQAANDINTQSDRIQIQKEIDSIIEEITDIGNKTEFNTKKILDGSLGYQTSPPIPQSTVTATGMGPMVGTADDGWMYFGSDPTLPHRVRLNPGEEVVHDPDNWLFTEFSISVYYSASVDPSSDRLPTSISIHSIPEGYVITNDYPGTTFSYNGMTIDMSQKTLPPNSVGGSQHQGNIYLTAGNNDAPVNNDIDNSLIIQTGANAKQNMQLDISDVRSTALSINNVKVLNNTSSQNAINSFENAVTIVSKERSKLGSYRNRLEHIHNNVSNYEMNLIVSESHIRDANMAKQMMEMTKHQILSQTSQAMLSHAGQQAQQVLQLFK